MRRTLTLLLTLQLTALSATALANSEECESDYTNGDFETAFDYCLEAANNGDSDAQQNVAVMYTMGWGTGEDDVKAFDYYKMAADNGVVDAQLTVGNRYNNGSGVTQNYAKAEAWWLKAARNGNSHAQSALGKLYTDGTKTERDLGEALRWRKAASESGHHWALKNMADVFNEGIVVPRNPVLAHAYYNLAAAQPYSGNAAKKRRAIEEEMTLEEISSAQKFASDCEESNYVDCFSESEVSQREQH